MIFLLPLLIFLPLLGVQYRWLHHRTRNVGHIDGCTTLMLGGIPFVGLIVLISDRVERSRPRTPVPPRPSNVVNTVTDYREKVEGDEDPP